MVNRMSTQLGFQDFDSVKTQAVAEKFLTVSNHGAFCLMAFIGYRTGLFDAMRSLPPSSIEQIANKAGLQERYVRAWLGAMVTAGVVEIDHTSSLYVLPAEHEAILTRAASPDNMAAYAQCIALLGGVEDEVFECFKAGEDDRKARELSEVLQQKTAISEILRAISNSPTNAQSVLDTVAEAAARLCDVTDAEIFQVEGDEVRLVAKHGPYRIWPIGFSLRIDRDLVIGRTVADRTSVHVHDLQAAETDFPQGAAYAKQYGHRTVFATPLLREGVAIGAILIRRLEVRPLTDNQIALLKTFADQAAIAIENVRLFKEIKEKSRKVEEQARELTAWNAGLESRVAEQVNKIERLTKLELELSLAGEIQKSMLPRSIPRLEGYEFSARMISAKSVGGDFFDFIPLEENLLGIAVGDVSDKGIPAALFMAMVRSLLRAEAHPGRSPKKVLRSVSHHLMDMNDKEMFVTIIFGILNRATHQFHYARAGHEAPVFFDGKGSIKRMPKTNGQALGILAEIALDEQTVEFSKGSMLLIYTDGIPDATNRQNVGFGFDGVISTVGKLTGSSAQVVCDELIRAATEHQAGAMQHDDMTVLVVRAV